MKKEAN